MKTALLCYSFSGNTRRVCDYLAGRLSGAGKEVRIVDLKPRQEERNFLRQGRLAREHAAPELEDPGFAAGEFDFLVFASPVWAFTFAPAMRSFLLRMDGLKDVPCACILTCGARLTSGNALKELAQAVGAKGGRVVFSEYVAGAKAADGAYLEKRLAGLFKTV